ncbi:unnamed protein product [Sphagnum balticum]
MARQGLPVPPGFTIPVNLCKLASKDVGVFESTVKLAALKVRGFVAESLEYKHGDYPLVSVRSGAAISQPGMLDTILNVGITDENLGFWQKRIGQRAALDSYRRLLQMYGQTVSGISDKKFKAALKEVMVSKYGLSKKPTDETKLPIPHLLKLIEKYKQVYLNSVGKAFPQTLEDQLAGAIGAVLQSWNSERAIEYRKINKISEDLFTACTIQAMVFGNLNDKSCSGVLFSRNPSTGEKDIMGEFLPNAQGEEVVSGTATPLSLNEFEKWNEKLDTELQFRVVDLEAFYKDMVDVEFTVEDGKLFILQSRVGKRSATAAFKIAYDFVKEGKLTKEEALKRVTSEQYLTLSTPVIDPKFDGKPIATGLAGSKGIAKGRIWLSSEKAKQNPGGILVSHETTPEDFSGMAASVGILTATGGTTSHAAVVARGMDRACVVGCTTLKFDPKYGIVFEGNPVSQPLGEGSIITIDGNTGNVFLGAVPMIGGTIPDFVSEMIEWGTEPGQVFSYDPLKDKLPSEGEVFLNCSGLNGNDLEVLVNGLKSYDKLHGVLAFEKPSKFDDSSFLTTLGIAKGSQIGQDQIQALKKADKRWTVVGVPETIHQANFYCRLHRKAKTLKDLMNAEGYYQLDKDLKELLSKQGVTIEEFADLLKKAGKNLKPLVTPVSRSELAFKVFGS